MSTPQERVRAYLDAMPHDYEIDWTRNTDSGQRVDLNVVDIRDVLNELDEHQRLLEQREGKETVKHYDYTGWEEDESSDFPGKYILTITEDGEEFATIVHRVSRAYPLDGPLAAQKVRNAQRIVNALNKENS